MPALRNGLRAIQRSGFVLRLIGFCIEHHLAGDLLSAFAEETVIGLRTSQRNRFEYPALGPAKEVRPAGALMVVKFRLAVEMLQYAEDHRFRERRFTICFPNALEAVMRRAILHEEIVGERIYTPSMSVSSKGMARRSKGQVRDCGCCGTSGRPPGASTTRLTSAPRHRLTTRISLIW